MNDARRLKSLSACRTLEKRQFQGELLEEELRCFQVEGGSAVASHSVRRHLHPSAGVSQARFEANREARAL